MAFHEGNASRRLASQSTKIYLLQSGKVPDRYKKEFLELRKIVRDTIKDRSSTPGLIPTRLRVRIPAYPDSGSGIIRTAFRQHPDTSSDNKILQ